VIKVTENKKDAGTEKTLARGKIMENKVYAAAVIGFILGVALTAVFFMGSQHYQATEELRMAGIVISDLPSQTIIDFPKEETELVRFKEGGRIDLVAKSRNGVFLARTLNGSSRLPLAYVITWEIPATAA